MATPHATTDDEELAAITPRSSIGSFEDWEQSASPRRSQEAGTTAYPPSRRSTGRDSKRERKLRYMMLACACCISIGSHFGTYLLGPLKTRMQSGLNSTLQSEADFSELITSFELINTITPLVSGFMVPTFGAARVGLVSTSLVVLGQVIVCWETRAGADDPLMGMLFGLFTFGLGMAPLAVVQESILLRSTVSNSVAKSVAAGLLLGKAASFAGAASAEPLSSIHPQLPFFVALSLSIFSLGAAVMLGRLERMLPLTPESKDMVEKGIIEELVTIQGFGDTFWLYMVVCALAGGWYSTIHLSSSLLQTIYGVTATISGTAASTILFSSILLYPTVGWVIDRRPQVLPHLFTIVPSSLLAFFALLLFIPTMIPLFLVVVPAALGIGMGPLLLVIVVPLLVDRKHVPMALGLHKSTEMAGAVLSQSFAAHLLGRSKTALEGVNSVLFLLLALAAIQLGVVLIWWRLIRRREGKRESEGYGLLPAGESGDARLSKGGLDPSEEKRGLWSLSAGGVFVFSSWVVFVSMLLSSR